MVCTVLEPRAQRLLNSRLTRSMTRTVGNSGAQKGCSYRMTGKEGAVCCLVNRLKVARGDPTQA